MAESSVRVAGCVRNTLVCALGFKCGAAGFAVHARRPLWSRGGKRGGGSRWWWQCQRGCLEWDGERETSGQIPAAEEHVKCEKLRQTVDLGRAVAGSQTKGFVLHVMCQKSHKQTRQGLGGQVGRRPQLRAVRVQAGQEGWELWEHGAH